MDGLRAYVLETLLVYLNWKTKSKLNQSFLQVFYRTRLFMLCCMLQFLARLLFLARTLAKTFALKYCNVYSLIHYLYSKYQVLYGTMSLSGGICRLVVIVCCSNQCSHRTKNQPSIDNSAPQLLSKESVSVNRSNIPL